MITPPEAITLILILCGPSHCREVPVRLYGATHLQCIMGAPMAMREAERHARNDEALAGWKCTR